MTADPARRSLGFLTAQETAALADQGVIVLDPGSTLVSPGIGFGAGVILWPGAVLQRLGDGRIEIGAGAEIGEEGGFTLKAESGHVIEVGAGARLLGGGSLTLSNRIGRGAQILGPIRCQNCRLGDGDTYRDPDPERRGGVLKGAGVARHIEVPQGHVIQAFGLFAEAPLRRQIEFHPPKA